MGSPFFEEKRFGLFGKFVVQYNRSQRRRDDAAPSCNKLPEPAYTLAAVSEYSSVVEQLTHGSA